MINEVIRGGTSARWHAVLYIIIAVALILLAYETLATQRLSGNGLEFTVGSGYAQIVNPTDSTIFARVKSPAPFIVESDDSAIRFDVSSKLEETQGVYEREIEIPSGQFNFHLTLGSNVTFSLSYEAHASATVVPYDSGDSMVMLTATGMSVIGSLYFAVRSLRAVSA